MAQVYDYRAFLEHGPALRESQSPDLLTLDEQMRKRQENPLRKSIQYVFVYEEMLTFERVALNSNKFGNDPFVKKDTMRSQLPSMNRTELPRWVQKMVIYLIKSFVTVRRKETIQTS